MPDSSALKKGRFGFTGTVQPRYIYVVLAVIIAVIAYSFAPVFIKALIAEGMSPHWIATIRLFVTAIIMSAFTILNRSYRAELIKLSCRELGLSALAGAFLAGHFVTWVFALQHTTSLASTAIICTQTLFSAVFSTIILRERQNKAIWVGIIPSIIGTIVIGWADQTFIGDTIGSLFAITSSIFISAYYVTGRTVRKTVGFIPYTWIVYLSGALLLVLYSTITAMGSFELPTLRSWILIVGLVLICTFIGHSVINWALKHIQAAFVSFVTLLQPILTYIWSALFLMEVARSEVWVGASFIIIGIAIFIPFNRKQHTKSK